MCGISSIRKKSLQALRVDNKTNNREEYGSCLRGGVLLLERRVAVLREVLAAAGEHDEVGAVLFQASHVGRKRLLLR